SHLSLFKGKDVFGIDLGDMVGDMPELFPEYISSMSPLDIPFYRSIGNHDMSYWGRSFETSERTFNNYFGPTVYSFNKGKAHYIVINNNFFVGRDYFYMGYIDEKTFRWLEKDLSFVPEGTLVFLMLHIPTRLQTTQQPFAYDYTTIADQTVNAAALHRLLEGYDTHILSGHMHYNLNVQFNDRLFEHNTAAVCGTWWRAPVCLDGTPRGYAVYEVKGNEVNWYYKSAGFDRSYQFRTYLDTSNGTSRIIANVWNYDDKWKVEWLENGKHMGQMERYKGHDPLAYKLCQDRERMKYDWIQPIETEHLFKATPVNRNASIQVRVTDRFGRVYLEDVKKER
ncbi:MAG: calcineurin-like phosphoesterase C-terminal domain-containing protein, partial [Pseudobacter sp.]|uniref:calcineurin-like phosphoesterase C-terminal domain-containing protein n=1 Tax=Pseudobacter sp. TaxID=2045420 RepID=UPI003F7FC789